jgi:hypothetical protein
VTSVPAGLVIRIVDAFARMSAAISTRSRNSGVGISRARSSGGSTAVRMRVPASWIANCSGLKSKNVQSTTMSAAFRASTAWGSELSPESPTAHAPLALAGAGRRR